MRRGELVAEVERLGGEVARLSAEVEKLKKAKATTTRKGDSDGTTGD